MSCMVEHITSRVFQWFPSQITLIAIFDRDIMSTLSKCMSLKSSGICQQMFSVTSELPLESLSTVGQPEFATSQEPEIWTSEAVTDKTISPSMEISPELPEATTATTDADKQWTTDAYPEETTSSGYRIDCPSTCEGLLPGPYQSCLGCNRYLICANDDLLLDGYWCQEGFNWDDIVKRCVTHSTTCPAVGGETLYPPTKPTTVTPEYTTSEAPVERIHCPNTCKGLQPGPYQSCLGCNRYLICFLGDLLLDGYWCPDGLSWDDNVKACMVSSTTCQASDSQTPHPPAEQTTHQSQQITTNEFATTELQPKEVTTSNPVPHIDCLSTCDNIKPGLYQSCLGCNQYLICYLDGLMFDGYWCEPGLSWDDDLKECVKNSSTCPTSSNSLRYPLHNPTTVPPGYKTAPPITAEISEDTTFPSIYTTFIPKQTTYDEQLTSDAYLEGTTVEPHSKESVDATVGHNTATSVEMLMTESPGNFDEYSSLFSKLREKFHCNSFPITNFSLRIIHWSCFIAHHPSPSGIQCTKSQT